MRPTEAKGMNPVLLAVLALALLAAAPARAGGILDTVGARAMDDGLELTITLQRPLAVRRHFPRRRGKILQLQLQAPQDDPALKRRERLQAPTQAAPLVEVVYEGNVRGGPFLVLRFAQVVEFEVPDERRPARKAVRVRLLGVQAKGAKKTAEQRPAAQPSVADRAEALYRQARAALTRGENDQAVLLFSQLLELPDNPFSREALEYLGVARERSGQLERARQIYQDYLERYPDSPRAATVRQRLLALEARLGLREAPRLRRSERRTNPQAPTVRRDHFGRVYQVLYNAYLQPENSTPRRARQLSLTYADLSARRRGPDSQWRTVLSGSYEYDFIADPDEPPGRFRIRSAYLDYQGKRRGLDFTLGRQSVRSGGVLGRFDGARLAYRVHRAVRLNTVAGAPVDYLNPDRIQTERPLAGVGIALEEPVPHWNGNAYLIEQRADGLVDRRAAGGDLRYFRDDRSAFVIIDYDLGYRVLNIATAHLGRRLGKSTRLNLHLDHRRSPILLTSNALLGVTNIPDDEYPVLGLNSADELRAIKADPRLATLAAYMDEQAIRDRALANTGKTDLITLGLIHDFGPRVQVNGNLNWTRNRNVTPILTTEDLLAAGPNPPQTITDDRSVNAQLILRDYFVPRDMFLLSLKLGDTSVYRIASVSAIARRPFGPAWRLEGRLRVEYTRRKGDDPWRAGKVSPALKADYRLNKRLALDAETGLDWYRTQQPNGDYRWTYFNLGLQLNF